MIWNKRMPIFDAVEENNWATITDYLENGGDPNAQMGQWTLLDIACQKGFKEIVKILLNRGANPLITHHCGHNLYISCLYGHAEIVELLLDCGADINLRSWYGSLLHIACRENKKEVAELLLKRGICVDFESDNKETAFFVACATDSIDIVKLLIKYNASIYKKPRWNETPLHNACKNSGNIEIINLLLDSGINIDAVGNPYHTALSYACWNGNLEVAQFLLDKGANCNIENSNNPLHSASVQGHTKIIELLMNHGMDVNIVNKRNNWTAYIMLLKRIESTLSNYY
jgi:ankyrin repeat protein